MSYEEQYEEYKKSLLKNHYFKDKFRQKYADVLHGASAYIDHSCIFEKLSGLSLVAGAAITAVCFMGDRTDARSIVVRIVMLAILVASTIGWLLVSSRHKAALGKSNFYSFCYGSYIRSKVIEDKKEEIDLLIEDLEKKTEALRYYSEKKDYDIDEIRFFSRKIGQTLKRYKRIKNYEHIARDIESDYYFSIEMKKLLDE